MHLMNKKKKTNKIADYFGIKDITSELAKYLFYIIKAKIEDEKADRETFQKALANYSDEELMLYVPDVYQKNIYKIDYAELWDKGIRFISFDIDDTINDIALNKINTYGPGFKITMPEDAKVLFKKLKAMGFIVTLLTNANEELAHETCRQLNADGYISRANKPETRSFEVMQNQYGFEKSQMAHVGNDMRTDVLGGNKFGITTCLVRGCGFSTKLVKFVGKRIGLPTKGHLIRARLLERDLWRKHHLKERKDQYYQLGETPAYRN